MSTPGRTLALGIVLVVVMGMYALFAGADLGGGIWDGFAGRGERADRVRRAIRRSITPVWEANNVWIVFGLVVFWTAFPPAFGAALTQLFVPLAAALLAITLRGVGFALHQEAERLPTERLTTLLFAVSSVAAPFFLGAAVGGVATGRVGYPAGGDPTRAWTDPVSLVTGALFTATCALVGAVFLLRDCTRRDEPDLVSWFRRRALAAAGAVAVLAAVNLWLLSDEGPYVFHRLLHTSWPLLVVTLAAGAAMVVLTALGSTRFTRPLVGVTVAGVVGAWAWAQFPYLLPTRLTLAQASATPTALDAQLVVVVVLVVLVGPSFVYLYRLQQTGEMSDGELASPQLRAAMRAKGDQEHPRADPGSGSTGPAEPVARHRWLWAMIVGVLTVAARRASR